MKYQILNKLEIREKGPLAPEVNRFAEDFASFKFIAAEPELIKQE